MKRVLDNHQTTPTEGHLLTDDLAPVEWLVNNMVIYFILSGGLEDLQQ
jgi:hypothetical protein